MYIGRENLLDGQAIFDAVAEAKIDLETRLPARNRMADSYSNKLWPNHASTIKFMDDSTLFISKISTFQCE